MEFQLDTYLEPTSAEDRKYVFVGLGKSKSDNTEKPDTENVFGVYLLPCFDNNNTTILLTKVQNKIVFTMQSNVMR